MNIYFSHVSKTFLKLKKIKTCHPDKNKKDYNAKNIIKKRLLKDIMHNCHAPWLTVLSLIWNFLFNIILIIFKYINSKLLIVLKYSSVLKLYSVLNCHPVLKWHLCKTVAVLFWHHHFLNSYNTIFLNDERNVSWKFGIHSLKNVGWQSGPKRGSSGHWLFWWLHYLTKYYK